MQPNQDMKNMQNNVGSEAENVLTASAPATPPNENIMAQGVPNGSGGAGDVGIDARGAGANEKSKMSKKQIIGLVVLSLIAVGGVLFGVFGMTSQNSQIAELKGQVSDANNKAAQLEAASITIEEPDGTTVEVEKSLAAKQNPVISATAPKYYNLGISSPRYTVNDTEYYVSLSIRDGDISSCALNTHTVKFIDYDMVETDRFDRNCDGISGISGKIYKAVTIGEGQDASMNSVAFIMEDGTVEYVSGESMVTEIVNNGTASIKGTLSIDGFVTDAFSVDVGEDGAVTGGYATTIFVLSDGSYVKYDESMLN